MDYSIKNKNKLNKKYLKEVMRYHLHILIQNKISIQV